MLPDIMDKTVSEYTNYFDICRVKSNVSDYTSVGEISQGEAEELIAEVIKFREIIQRWIEKYNPEYLQRQKILKPKKQCYYIRKNSSTVIAKNEDLTELEKELFWGNTSGTDIINVEYAYNYVSIIMDTT